MDRKSMSLLSLLTYFVIFVFGLVGAWLHDMRIALTAYALLIIVVLFMLDTFECELLYKLKVRYLDKKIAKLEHEWLMLFRSRASWKLVTAARAKISKANAERDALLFKGQQRGWKSE